MPPKSAGNGDNGGIGFGRGHRLPRASVLANRRGTTERGSRISLASGFRSRAQQRLGPSSSQFRDTNLWKRLKMAVFGLFLIKERQTRFIEI